MSQVQPPTIDPAPPVPIRGTPTFKDYVDAFLTWMALVVTQFQALATNCYNNAVDCYNNAVAAVGAAAAALNSASQAAASAVAAATAAGAPVWVSGATIAQYSPVLSPLDLRIYRRTSATGSGTTDPKLDTSNYAAVPTGALLFLHVREQYSSGTNGGTSTSLTAYTRNLNTTVGANTIPGSSLSSSLVSLPAGTYDFEGYAVSSNSAGGPTRLSLYNSTDSTEVLLGPVVGASSGNVEAVVSGRFTISATKNISLSHYIGNGQASTGLGYPGSFAGKAEIYSELKLWKVA
jgi:hypothetical protein